MKSRGYWSRRTSKAPFRGSQGTGIGLNFKVSSQQGTSFYLHGQNSEDQSKSLRASLMAALTGSSLSGGLSTSPPSFNMENKGMGGKALLFNLTSQIVLHRCPQHFFGDLQMGVCGL